MVDVRCEKIGERVVASRRLTGTQNLEKYPTKKYRMMPSTGRSNRIHGLDAPMNIAVPSAAAPAYNAE